MSIEKIMTDAWQQQKGWLYLLLPLSAIYAGVIRMRKSLYKAKIFSSYKAPVPVMVVGNITVGGSGKTPLIIALVNYLKKHQVKVVVISRGYGGDTSKMPMLVEQNSHASVVGDEPCLIVQSTQVPMSVCPNRQQAIELLLQKYPDTQLIISDDGLQHYKLQRDIEWIVVDEHRGFGNKQLLPTGFLREPMTRLDGAMVVYHHTLDDKSLVEKSHPAMYLEPDGLQSLQNLIKADIDQITNKRMNRIAKDDESVHQLQTVRFPNLGDEVYAVSGIGYPQRFFDTLQTLGYKVLGNPYPDHHDFSAKDIIHIAKDSGDKAVIITSKDAVKIKQVIIQQYHDMARYQQILSELDDLLSRLFILPVNACLNDQCFVELKNHLDKFDIKIS